MAEERKVEFAGSGTIKKCPNCGAQLEAFQARCPVCGFAIGGAERGGSVSLKKFLDAYTNEKDNARKLEMVNTFPIPNTIEDTIEFAIVASQQVKTYAMSKKGLDKKDGKFAELCLKGLSNMTVNGIFSNKIDYTDFCIAWKNKLDEAYMRAKISYPNDEVNLKNIYMLVTDAEDILDPSKNKKLLKRFKKESKVKKIILSIIAFYVVMGVLGFILTKDLDKKENLKRNKFENLMTEIQADIDEGNYDDAELKLLDFDVRYEGESWREKKEFLKKQLEKAKEKAGE
ncbi:MAG: zinc ribbon domain-containing protein [Treponema sp.]|nr:zinc ribbon domain-containing protein [Treponema sp.]